MISKIRKIYKPEYMNRPVVYKTFTKFIVALVLCLLWFRFIDKGVRGLDDAFTIMGLLFLCFSWFNYLSIDGVRVGHLMMGWKKKKRNTVHFNKDIADFVDEEVVDFDELANEEKTVVRFITNILTGIIYLILAAVFTLI